MSSWSKVSSLFFTQTPDPVPSPAPVQEPDGEEEMDLDPKLLAAATAASEIQEGCSFSDLYARHGVPASAYPVEKLLAVIEGLANMSSSQIRMVITAMDAADTSWTIDDPVQDATNKIAALEQDKKRIDLTVSSIEDRARAEAEVQDAQLTQTSASIKGQIDALQAQLHEEITRATASKAEGEARVKAAKEAGTREKARLDAEASRLVRVPNTFGGKL